MTGAIPIPKVFVGNLSYDTTPGDLEKLFTEVGDVGEVFLPNDRATGRPRGFAFVEFDNAEAVTQAIEKFDGHDVKGRPIRVSVAEERPRRPPRQFDGGGGGGGDWGGGPPRGAKGGAGKPKGSRRNARGKKRSL